MDEAENDSSVSVSKESHQENLNYHQYKKKDFDSISIRIPLLSQNFNNSDNRDAEFRLLKTRFCRLQEEHKKLIAITSELTSALQLNILGQTRNLQCVLDHCRVIYPTLFVSQNNRQQNLSASHKTDKHVDKTGHADTTLKNEQLSHTKYNENAVDVQETVDQVERELTVNVVPNLNLENIHHENEGKLQLETQISEEEIKEMLETIFIKAIRHITEDHTNVKSECCQTGRACLACRSEISQIVESILAKVVESPRFKISPRYSTTANSCNTDLHSSQHQLQISKGLSVPITDSLTPKLEMVKDEENCDKPENASVFSKSHTSSLDYHEVKKDLLKEDNDEKIRILRALRRGLTKSNESERQQTLEVYIRHDILNIYGKQPLMELLLQSGSLYLNEHVFRLINTIASFRQGRSYLSSNDKLIKTMLLPKFMENPPSPIKDMLAAALQKLSLQKQMRICMVDEGLLDYLIKFLDESFQNLSLYSLECCTALLMNLMLVDEAQKYCVANADKVVKLLKKFLREPRTALLPYVNGIMLSLLVYENINVEARKQSLDEVIHKLLKDTQDEYLRRQLSFIIQLRFSKQLQLFIGDDDENPGVDILERELDTDSEEQMLEEGKDGQKLDNEGATKLNSNALSTRHEQVNKRSLHHSSARESSSKLSTNKKPNKPLLVISGSKKKRILRAPKSFPRTSFCYLEICQEFHNGSRFCRCAKCIPGKSRYSCGCYEVIRKEVAEEIDSVCKAQTISTTKYVKKTFKGSSVEVVENSQESYTDPQCAICGDQICNCAFESRPKIHRTPPKT